MSGFLSAAPAFLESPTCTSCIPIRANGLSKEAETAGVPYRPSHGHRDCPAMAQHDINGSERRPPCRQEHHIAGEDHVVGSAILPGGKVAPWNQPWKGFQLSRPPGKRRNGAVSARSRQVFGPTGHSGCRDLRKIRMQHRSPCCLKRRG